MRFDAVSKSIFVSFLFGSVTAAAQDGPKGTCLVPENPSKSVAFFANQVANGDAQAMETLGALYMEGLGGLAKDPSRAFGCYLAAAQQGRASAQDQVGFMYIAGKGVIRDSVKSVEWTTKAADQGYAPAQHKMGMIYEVGQFAPKDKVAAAEWYRKAADQDFAASQLYLGELYQSGQGVPLNKVEALKWYTLAARERKVKDPKLTASAREKFKTLEATMTPEEVREAEHSAAAFTPVVSKPSL